MDSVTITRKEANIANIVSDKNDYRKDLQQVYVFDGFIAACDGFSLAIRQVEHAGNTSFPAYLLKGIKKVTKLIRTPKGAILKEQDKTTHYALTHSVDMSKIPNAIKHQMPLREPKSCICLDKKLLLKVLSALPSTEKRTSGQDYLRIYISGTDDPIRMTCDGTTAIMMPMQVEWPDPNTPSFPKATD